MSENIKMTDKSLRSILGLKITKKETMIDDKHIKFALKETKMQLRLVLRCQLK